MKKALVGAAAAMSLALFVAGCSTGAGAGTDSDSGAVVWPAQDAKLDGVELTIWAAAASSKIPEAVISAFEDSTGAKVTVDTIPDPYEAGVTTKIATGDKPDLAFWSPGVAAINSINPAENLQVLDGAPWVSSLEPSLQDAAGLVDGKRYAALISSPSVLGVYYNKDAFEKAGISEPPADFDELLADAATLKAAGITPFYDIGGDMWATQWFWQIALADEFKGGMWDRMSSNEEKFTDAPSLDAIKLYADLIEKGYFNDDIKTGTFVQQGEALLSGSAAMAVQINALGSEMLAASTPADLDAKIGFVPISKSGHLAVTLPDQTNGLIAFKTGDAKRESAARQLLEFWMGDGYETFIESQQAVSIEPAVPTPSTVTQLFQDVAAAYGNSTEGGETASINPFPALHVYLSNMIAGTMTPEQVAEAAQADYEKTGKALGLAGY